MLYVFAVLGDHIWFVKFMRNQPVYILQLVPKTLPFINVYNFYFTPSPICF